MYGTREWVIEYAGLDGHWKTLADGPFRTESLAQIHKEKLDKQKRENVSVTGKGLYRVKRRA